MAWGFCIEDDVKRELGPNVRVPTAMDVQSFIEARAAHIRTVLATRGVTAEMGWEGSSSMDDTWQLLKLANVKGAAADVLASLYGLQDSARVSDLLSEYGRPSAAGRAPTGLMAQVEEVTLPGVDSTAGTQARGVTSYATNNPTDTTNDPGVTRDMEF